MLIGEMVYLGSRGMTMDLIVIDMFDFDVILDMDFLSKYEAKKNYRKKNVWFNLDSGEQFAFEEGRVLSLMISNVKERKGKCWVNGV